MPELELPTAPTVRLDEADPSPSSETSHDQAHGRPPPVDGQTPSAAVGISEPGRVPIAVLAPCTRTLTYEPLHDHEGGDSGVGGGPRVRSGRGAAEPRQGVRREHVLRRLGLLRALGRPEQRCVVVRGAWGRCSSRWLGNIIYVNQSDSASLAYVTPAGNAVIKIDNTTTVPDNYPRNSVRRRRLVGCAVAHRPAGRCASRPRTFSRSGRYGSWTSCTSRTAARCVRPVLSRRTDRGCSPAAAQVWPSIWTKGAQWPDEGEIDIIEGVNLMTYNQMALHSGVDCTMPLSNADQTGTALLSNCNTTSGCTVVRSRAFLE